jgi:hypothetical protein
MSEELIEALNSIPKNDVKTIKSSSGKKWNVAKGIDGTLHVWKQLGVGPLHGTASEIAEIILFFDAIGRMPLLGETIESVQALQEKLKKSTPII